MQERRTTVRIPTRRRIQYCPASDCITKDGRLTDLSERGAALLLHEAHQDGEPITASFTLPGEEGSVTATGLVRWSAPRGQGWTGVGLSWLPLDETSQHRLQRFLSSPSRDRTSPLARPEGELSDDRWVRKVAIPTSGALVILLVVWAAWALAMHRRSRELEAAIQARNAAIAQLERRDARMHQELALSRAHLSATAEEIARLDWQAQRLEGEAQRLGQDVQRVHHSYLQASREREELLRRLQEVERQRAQGYVPLDQLQLAIREAIAMRLAGEQRPWRMVDRSLIGGNRGYLVSAPPDAAKSPTVSIRVHEPESVP